MKSLLCVVVVALASGCIQSNGSGWPWKWTVRPQGRQYVLKLDARNGAEHQICYREADQDPKAEPKCRPFAGDPLDTPGTLTVLVKNRDLSKTYDLRVSSFTTEANPAAVSAMIDRVLGNLQQLATLGAGEVKKDIRSESAAKVVEAITSKVLDDEAAVTGALKSLLAVKTEKAHDTHDPAVLFEEYVDNKKLRRPSDTSLGERGLNNAPLDGAVPPPRAANLTAEDVVYLIDPQRGITIDELANHIVDWCAPPSFDAGFKWPDRFKIKIDEAATKTLARDLGLTPQSVATAILTNPHRIQERQGQLMDLALADWDKASTAAKTYFLMHWATSLKQDLATCNANLKFIEKQVADKTVLASIAKVRGDIAAFETQLKPATDAFGTFAPVFMEATRLVKDVLQLQGETFASFSLQTGILDLGLGEKTGADRREVGTFKLDVNGVEKFAITVGPAMLWCKNCFQRIEIKASPGTDSMPASRQLVTTKDSREYAVVAALHATMWSTRRIGIGLLLGYPITQPADTAKSALLGIGIRRSAIQFGIGLHAFATKKLVSDNLTLPINLNAPGNEALTVDDITTERVEHSWFAYFGYSKSL